MNVLLYVVTMLMLLASLTYARLDSFRVFSGQEASFNHYMQSTERVPLDRLNEKMYDKIVIKTKNQNKRSSANTASPRLSLYILLKKDWRDANQTNYQQIRELFRNLMTYLYGNQPFFQEMIYKRPNFLNEILDEVVNAADNEEELKLKNATVLSKLEFENKDLQYTFFLMLHGLPKLQEQPQEFNPFYNDDFIIEATITGVPDTDEELLARDMSDEASSFAGYDSLIDYLTVKKATKLRVFLAPKALLMAIYGDEDTVASVMKARKELFKQVKKGELKPDQASEQFKNTFSQLGNAPEFSAILDFGVSNTDPKKYE